MAASPATCPSALCPALASMSVLTIPSPASMSAKVLPVASGSCRLSVVQSPTGPPRLCPPLTPASPAAEQPLPPAMLFAPIIIRLQQVVRPSVPHSCIPPTSTSKACLPGQCATPVVSGTQTPADEARPTRTTRPSVAAFRSVSLPVKRPVPPAYPAFHMIVVSIVSLEHRS